MSIVEIYRHSSNGERLRIAALCIFLGTCFFAGGASRSDVLGPTIVRLAAIVVIALSIGSLNRRNVIELRTPLLLLVTAGMLMLLQLVPLPPGAWHALPGRQLFAEVVGAVGRADAWHALSLTPDMTLNSLLALLPAFAVLLAVASLPHIVRYALLPLFVAGAVASAVLGLLQITDGTDSLYLYRITNEGFPVGFFSNRNHQALLLAMAIPVIVLWAVPRASDESVKPLKAVAAVLCVLLIIPMILVAGSRAAFVAALLALIPALLQIDPAVRRRLLIRRSATTKYYVGGALALITMVVLATFWMSRDQSVSRIFSVDVSVDQRYVFLPTLMNMIRDSFPFGFGFGSFQTVFRSYEPVQHLGTTYFNHAHNDFIELAIEGGLAGLLILSVFIVWVITSAWRAWRQSGSSRFTYARLASIILGMAFLSSIVDYPLRTPFYAAFIAFAVSWLAAARRTAVEGSGQRSRDIQDPDPEEQLRSAPR